MASEVLVRIDDLLPVNSLRFFKTSLLEKAARYLPHKLLLTYRAAIVHFRLASGFLVT